MLQYVINLVPRDLPRTTTRAQYAEISRWLRLTRREIARKMEAQHDEIQRGMFNLMAFGSAEFKMRALDNLANPPLCVINPPDELNLRAIMPGHIHYGRA